MTDLEALEKYVAMFKAPLPENVSDKKYFDIARECVEKGKSAFELGYTDDDGAFGEKNEDGTRTSYYY